MRMGLPGWSEAYVNPDSESHILIFEASLTLVGMISFQLIADVDAKPKFSVRDQCYAGADMGKKHLVRWQLLRMAQ